MNPFFSSERLKVALIALAGALFVSALYGLPNFFIEQRLSKEGKIYHPVTLSADWDEAAVYAPLVRETAKSLRQRDPSLAEHRDAHLLLPPSGPLVFGFFVRFFGLEPVWIFVDYILPPLIFLLLFTILYLLTQSGLFSLLLGLVFICTRQLISFLPFSSWSEVQRFLLYFKPYISQIVESRLPFDRMFSPEWTYIPLTLFFLLLIVAFSQPRKIWYVCAGLSYGFLFYTYFYDWVAVSVFLGILMLLSFVYREKTVCKAIAYILAIGLILSIGYWISFWQISQLPHYLDIKERTGLEVGRVLRLTRLPQYVYWLAAAVWLLWRPIKSPRHLMAAGLFLSAIVVMNLQLLTGYVPQPWHFLVYPLALMLFLAHVILFKELISQYGQHLRMRHAHAWLVGLIILGSGLIVARGVQSQISFVKNNAWRYTLPLSLEDSYAWLRQRKTPESVVLSPSFITTLNVSLFSENKVFFPPTAFATSASNQEIVERYIIAAKLFNTGDDRVREMFSLVYLPSAAVTGYLNESAPGEVYRFESYVAPLLHDYMLDQTPEGRFRNSAFRATPDIDEFVENALLAWQENPAAMLEKYNWQYVYVGPYEKEVFHFSLKNSAVCLSEVYSNSEVQIFSRCSEENFSK